MPAVSNIRSKSIHPKRATETGCTGRMSDIHMQRGIPALPGARRANLAFRTGGFSYLGERTKTGSPALEKLSSVALLGGFDSATSRKQLLEAHKTSPEQKQPQRSPVCSSRGFLQGSRWLVLTFSISFAKTFPDSF